MSETKLARCPAVFESGRPRGNGPKRAPDVRRVERRSESATEDEIVFHPCMSIRSWALNNVDAYVATMESPALRARHALLGIGEYPTNVWHVWTALLPESALDDSEVSDLAADVLTEKLLPSIATTDDDETLRALPKLVEKVNAISSADSKNVTAALRRLSAVGWGGADGDDPPARLLWARKRVLFDAVIALFSSDSGIDLTGLLVGDLEQVLNTVDLIPPSVATRWLELCVKLPESAVRSLSDRVDEYETRDGEEASVLRIKLGVRGMFNGEAPGSAEITSLSVEERTTAITDVWLALSPDSDDVRSLFVKVNFTATAFRVYCGRLSTEDRTQMWVDTARGPSNVAALLAATGHAGGIGTAAVEHIRTVVNDTTRERERAAQIELLLGAQISSEPGAAGHVKKAASELANDLLDKGVAGDLRSAAKIAKWAGRAGHGYTTKLRERFTSAVKQHGNALSNSLAQDLESMGLLVVTKKGILARLVGRLRRAVRAMRCRASAAVRPTLTSLDIYCGDGSAATSWQVLQIQALPRRARHSQSILPGQQG